MSQPIASSVVSSHSMRRLLPSASFVGCGDLLFRNISSHSKNCGPGTLFVAVAGSNNNGHNYTQEAISRGACGVLTSVPLVGINVPQCVVSDVRRCYAWLCQYLAGQPANSLEVLGVTGTNGKTTICWMLRSILKAASKKPGLLGTIEYDDSANPPTPATMTTPDASEIANWLQQMARQSASHAVLEVSSHALEQKRIAGLSLRAAIISNITHDHLDYHGNLKSYILAKSMIQDFCASNADLVINGDDPIIQEALSLRPCNIDPITVGFSTSNQYRISVLEQSSRNSKFEISFDSQTLELNVPLPGKHNIINAALAATTASRLGCSNEEIISGIAQAKMPCGRMEKIDLGQNFDCYIDYAHTPDAISNVINSMKPLVSGRIICLFGAGGNRDRNKRPMMALAAHQADLVVLTSDNSRDESVHQIFHEICEGFPDGCGPDYQNEDRAQAIAWAIDHAQPNDCVLLLGKGHETGQEILGKVHQFDDRHQARIAIANRLAVTGVTAIKVPA
ncbi:MAG: UDP-N-acetylmuramoyl-L-alanyl-D-glutamate--2,6-diaminopimelate ligase [Planctomycetaceae bacterium]|nr:UDP-N-acetylmuramoyl-L-alanyl-D-glutamate--2,6-diaminopimelate ligase [Planctomycetaceae bacterium]